MGYYEDLYNNISNPLDDDALLDYIIDCYSDNKSIYNSITRYHLSQKKYHNGEYYPAKKDAYWVKLFNIWKNSVLSLNRNQINYATTNNPGFYGDLGKLINYLRNMPEVKTADEFWALANDDNNLISRYGFQTLGEYSSWHHIDSSELSFHTHRRPPIEHRLYLNSESVDTFDIATLFTDKCMARGIPFYYKFDDFANRDDSLVIYSSSKYLKYYIEILREIKKENPELCSRLCDPPSMSGKIDGWIGYGSEPERGSNGNLRSFNEVRANAIKRALEKTTNEWIFRNVNKKVRQGNREVTIGEIIESRIVNSLYNVYYNRFNDYKSRGNASAFYELYGLVEQDFTSGNFRNLLYYNVHQNFNSIINRGVQNSISCPPITIHTRENKIIHIYYSNYEAQFKKMGSEIRRNDPSYKRSLKKNIETEFQREGIDIKKSCFDIDKFESLLKDDQEVELARQTSLQEEQRKLQEERQRAEERARLERQKRAEEQRRMQEERQRAEERARLERQRRAEEQRRLQEERERLLREQRAKQEAKRKREAASSNGIDFNRLCSMLDNRVLNKRMVLPNGSIISGKEYLRNYVFPHIPENGKFILKSGAEMSYLQFIDGFVMFIGQAEYSGDMAKLMEDNVVANKGTIVINGRRIKASEIVNYCNPDILAKNVRFPNGKAGKFKDYVSTYFSKYIPENGRFILENGSEISATQYIEEYVYRMGQSKYSGNASNLLFNTTRANKGVLLDRREKSKDELSQMLSNTTTNNNSNSRGGRRNG